MSLRTGLLVFLFVLFVGTVSCKITTLAEAECGWVGMKESDCVAKGCVWLPHFKGPWCQYPDSPFIPSVLSRFGLDPAKLNEDQIALMQICLLIFVTLGTFAMFHEKEVFFGISQDILIPITFFFLAWITRYYRLDRPADSSFDEYYFGQFTNLYCKRELVFDIHPPLAKLTFYYIGQLLGHECTFDFHGKGLFEVYNNQEQYIHLRQISAFFGTIVVPLGYMLARSLQFSVPASIIMGTLLLVDILLLGESRLILTDPQLFFYIVLSVYCAVRLWHTKSCTWERNLWTLFTGIACGCAFSVKFTALATLGWIIFISVTAYYSHLQPLSLFRCLMACVIGGLVFLVPFYIHFSLTEYTSDLAWNLDVNHQKLLIGHAKYDPSAPQPWFFPHLKYLINRMLQQNAASLGSHPYASLWSDWLVSKGALLSYAEHDNELDWHGHLFLVSNPYVAYSILVAILVFIPTSLLLVRKRMEFGLTRPELMYVLHGWMFFFGWVSNFIPYVLVKRTTYVYHYLPSQFFGMLLVALVLDFIPHEIFSVLPSSVSKELTPKARIAVVISFVGILLLGFYRYGCLAYAFGITQAEWDSIKWIISK